jgi:predicted dienelactone hydrolase
MRFFEVVILVSVAFMLIKSRMPVAKKPVGMTVFFLLVLISVVLHIFLEKPRWQMVPAYGLLGILTCAFLIRYFFQPGNQVEPPKLFKRLGNALGFYLGWLTFIVAVLLPVVLPVFKYPAPSGPYPVGTRDFYFVDQARAEVFSAEPTAKRELMVRVWYPAHPESEAQTQSYWPEAERIGPLILSRYGLPGFALNYLALVKTHSYWNAPPANSSTAFPVLIFSHGYAAFDYSMNLTQMEELASHGYIVFSISHTYEVWATVFPDGRVVTTIDQNADATAASENINLDARLEVWVADTEFVLGQLERINAEAGDPLAGKMDLERLGFFGMSFGGATAGKVCQIDPRCKAGANMDGYQFGNADFATKPLRVPFLFFYSEPNQGMNDEIYAGTANRTYRVIVRGAIHSNFTDGELWSPLLKYTGAPIDPRRMISIVNAYLLAFFDRYLKGEEAPLLDMNTSPYSEVDFQRR